MCSWLMWKITYKIPTDKYTDDHLYDHCKPGCACLYAVCIDSDKIWQLWYVTVDTELLQLPKLEEHASNVIKSQL